MTYAPRPNQSYMLTPGDKDTVPKTARKANTTALATITLALVYFWGYGEPPTQIALQEALVEIGLSILQGAASWIATYYSTNYVKKPKS